MKLSFMNKKQKSFGMLKKIEILINLECFFCKRVKKFFEMGKFCTILRSVKSNLRLGKFCRTWKMDHVKLVRGVGGDEA